MGLFWRKILSVMFLMTLFGCGFNAEYDVLQLPHVLRAIYVDMPQHYHPAYQYLRQELRLRKVDLLAQKQKGAAILQMTYAINFTNEHNATSTQARICKVNVTLRLTVCDERGVDLTAPINVSGERSVLLKAHELVENSAQPQEIGEILLMELIDRSLYQLFSPKRLALIK